MGEPVQGIAHIGIESSVRNSEVIEQVSQENKDYSVKRRQSLRARYVYAFIFFTTNILAWLSRDYGNRVFDELQYTGICGEKGAGCSYARGVLRVSLGCFIFFTFMFVTTCGASSVCEARNSWHSSWWSLKFLLYLVSVVVPFLTPVSYIHIYGEIARIGAGTFLFLQLLSVTSLITWCNDKWMPDSQPTQCGFVGLFLATITNIASFCAIIVLYIVYAPEASCTFNIFFITWTAVLVNVLMVVSLHSKVNRGLLSSGIMGSYIVFLCCSAIHSEPPMEKCKVRKIIAENGEWTTILGFLVAIFAIVFSTFSTGIDSRAFQFNKNETESEGEIPYKYGIFHFIFAMGAMYFAMLFISWEMNHPMKKWSIDVGWASTWVKIANEWFAASFFLWKLVSPVIVNKNLDSGDPEQQVHMPV